MSEREAAIIRALSDIRMAVSGLEGADVIELGVGLIGIGAVRARNSAGPGAAAEDLSAAAGAISSLHIDMRRMAAERRKETQ